MGENGNSSKWVNTLLHGELVEAFELVKEYYAIGNNSDVIRFLVKKAAREIQGSGLVAGKRMEEGDDVGG